MGQVTERELLAELERLRAENAALRENLHHPGAAPSAGTRTAPNEKVRRRRWGWTLLATALILLGALLAPAAVVASWARVQLTDTDSFVATYAPLANNPAVQSFVTDQAVDVIEQNIDIPALTSQVVDGITALGTGPAATRALEALKGPAAQGIISLIRSTVGTFVQSDSFADVWREALRISHTQLVATMQNDPEAAIAIASDGSVGIQLGPIIERVKEVLLQRGLSFASQIPTVDRTVTVVQNSSLSTVQVLYELAIAAGAWLPWISVLLLAGGVIVSRRRSIALIWASVALGLSMVVVVAGIGIGRVLFAGSVAPSLLPSGVAYAAFDAVSTAMRDTGVAVLVLAITVAITAWYAGPFGLPRRLRGFFNAGTASLRTSAERHGVSTGRTGNWIYSQRALLRAAVAVIAAASVLLLRPLTPGVVIWTLVLSAVVIAALELAQRPPIQETGETT